MVWRQKTEEYKTENIRQKPRKECPPKTEKRM